jgi:predicted DNA repair protein MutK
VLGWLSYAVLSAIVGLILGGIVAVLVHMLQKARILKSVSA